MACHLINMSIPHLYISFITCTLGCQLYVVWLAFCPVLYMQISHTHMSMTCLHRTAHCTIQNEMYPYANCFVDVFQYYKHNILYDWQLFEITVIINITLGFRNLKRASSIHTCLRLVPLLHIFHCFIIKYIIFERYKQTIRRFEWLCTRHMQI